MTIYRHMRHIKVILVIYAKHLTTFLHMCTKTETCQRQMDQTVQNCAKISNSIEDLVVSDKKPSLETLIGNIILTKFSPQVLRVTT